MRLSPSGRRVAGVTGYGLRPPQPRVTVRLDDDREIVVGLGHDPRWVFEDAIVYRSVDDGPVWTANEAGAWVPVPTTLPSGNVIAAGEGKVAVSRTDPRRILTSWRGTIGQATDPALSEDGDWLAYLLPDQPRDGVSTLVVERADGSGDERILWTGAPARPRFGSRTLCWEDGGRVLGVADVANPTSPVVDLTLGGWSCSAPVPAWVPDRGELYVVLVRALDGETGEIVLREWAAPRILVLGRSGGSAFDLDCRPVGRDLRAVWLTPTGELFSRGVSLDLPRELSQPPEPEPEPDVPVEWWSAGEGPVIDLWPLVLASASAISPDGRTVYLSKSDTDPLRAEWWRLADNDEELEHLEDRTRVDGVDPGWFQRDPFLAPRRVRSGQTWTSKTREMFDRATGRWQPYSFTAVAHVAKAGTIGGEPITVRLDIDNRPPAGSDGRRRGRVEWFWLTHRWRRWTDLWDDPTVPGDALSIVIGHDGKPRDFISDPPKRKPYVACPRPDPLPPPNPRPEPPPDPEPEPMPSAFKRVPRNESMDFLSWLRGDVYPGLVGHALDDEGIAAWGFDQYIGYRQEMGHEPAKHRVFADIQRVVRGTPPPPPIDPIDPVAAPAPVIHVDGRVFRNADGTLHDGREASAFMLLARMNRGEDVTPVVRGWRQRRMNWLRAVGMVGTDFWRSRGWDLRPSYAGYDADLDRLCALTASEGMGLRFTLFADAQVCCPSRAERGLVAQRVGRVLSRYRHVVAEIANEPSLNGFAEGDPRELADLARILKAESPHTLVALGAEHGARGHYATMAVSPADYVTFHAERRTEESGHAWPRRLSEYAVLLSPDEKDTPEWRAFFPAAWREMPGWSGEPINAGSEGAPGDFQTDPAVWFAYGALSRIVPSHGYVPCLHLHRGLWAELPGDEATEACVRAFHAGCDAVPLACKDGTWVNGHWDSAPWEGFRQTDPPSDDRPARIFGRIVRGIYWGVAIRAPHGWNSSRLRYPVTLVTEQRGERFGCQVWRS